MNFHRASRATLAVLVGLTALSTPAEPAGARRTAMEDRGDRGTPAPAAAAAPEPPRRAREICRTPEGEAVPAAELLEELGAGRDVVLSGRVIEGSLEADALWPSPDSTRLSDRVIPGRLRLESCRVTGRIGFPRTVLRGAFEMPCTEIVGDLDLTGSSLLAGLAAPRLRVAGRTRLEGLVAGQPIDLSDARLADGLLARNARIPGLLSLAGAETGGDLDLAGSVVGALNLSSLRVGGAARLEDLVVASGLSADDAVFTRGLVMESVRVLGDTDLSEASAGGGVRISRSRFDGDLDLDLIARTSLTLSDSVIAEDLSLFDGRFDAMTIEHVRVAGGVEFEDARFRGKVVIRDATLGEEFTASDAVFLGDCEFIRARFPGPNPFDGALFARAPVLVDTPLATPPRVRDGADPDPEEEDGEF